MSNKLFTKEACIQRLLGVEKGYSNNEDDPGKKTRWGITEAKAKEFHHLWAEFDWDGEMRTLPKDMAIRIYEIDFWDRLQLDDVFEISPVLADGIFDAAVNCGYTRAGSWLQRLLNVFNLKGTIYNDIRVDFKVGPKTIQALRDYVAYRKEPGIQVILNMFLCLKGAHYVVISENNEDLESFTFGWAHHRIVDDILTLNNID